jgi:DNA polymerase III subunit delta
MVIYLYGADMYRSRQYLKEQVSKFKSTRDPHGYNVIFLDSAKESPGKILTELLSSPFLAARRLIVLENLLNHSDADFLKEFLSRLLEKRFPESNVIIVWQGEAPVKNKVAKALHETLAAEKYAEQFEALNSIQLQAWIVGYTKKYQRTIARSALDFLEAEGGKDLLLLQNVLDQAVAYVGSRTEITLADVSLFLDKKLEDNIFNLVDVIVGGNHMLARQLLHAARQADMEEGYLFNMIIRQVRILLGLRDCYDHAAHFNSDYAAKELGVHPYVAKKSLPLIKRSAFAQLKNLHASLLDIDRQVKNGLAPQAVLIDLLIGKI